MAQLPLNFEEGTALDFSRVKGRNFTLSTIVRGRFTTVTLTPQNAQDFMRVMFAEMNPVERNFLRGAMVGSYVSEKDEPLEGWQAEVDTKMKREPEEAKPKTKKG